MNVVSLFSGLGGFDLGIIRAGHRVVWANDILADAAATYRRNIGEHIVEGDLTKIPSSCIPDADLVIGGFPCQGFSIANMDRRSDDPRNRLYRSFVRVVKDKGPKYFLAENVRGILSIDGGAVFPRICREFERAGYEVRHALLNASDYGVPQNRFRVFLLGVRKGAELPGTFPPPPSHGPGRCCGAKLTIRDAIFGLPDPDEPNQLDSHTYSKFKLKSNGYINHRSVPWDRPAPTVTARGDLRGGAMVNYHPDGRRRLTVRETARIQGLPDNHSIVGAMTSGYLQVANAVPPPLATAIARAAWPVSATTPDPRRAKSPRTV